MTTKPISSTVAYQLSQVPPNRPSGPLVTNDRPPGAPHADRLKPRATLPVTDLPAPRAGTASPEVLTIQQQADRARSRLKAFTAGPVSAMLSRNAALLGSSPMPQSLGVDTTRPVAAANEERKIVGDVVTPRLDRTAPQGSDKGKSTARLVGGSAEIAEQKHGGAISSLRTVLRSDEIADLKRFHDNSLAASTRRAYQSDYDNFVDFLRERFPRLPIGEMQIQCTLEHVLAYLNELCNQGKKISTINRRLSTLKKHVLPGLFTKATVPGSRDEQMLRDVEAIVRGIRRTVGAEHHIRGKKPLLIEDIRSMCDVAAEAVDDDDKPMPNKRCRDVCLLLFMFHSAMRRSEIAHLLWSDLTFDKRGVVVVIRKSKTDKESKGQTIALPRLDHHHCPVVALEKWKAACRGEGESPVFRWISQKDEIEWRVLIDQRIVAIVKHYCTEIGHDPACFAAHSTRSGYVTSSSEKGVPISELMKRTRHKAVSSLTVYMKSDDLFSSAGDARL